MTAEEQENIRSFVEGIAVTTITMPSQRDRQRAPGPSDLANKCDVCVAKKIAASLGLGEHGDGGFSLKAWLGTAVHEKLERDLRLVYPGARQEITVVIGDIPGIGLVKGHIDLYLPKKRAINDWKTTDMDKLEKYRKGAGPSAFTQGLTFQEREELEELKRQDEAGRLDPATGLVRLSTLMARAKEHSGGIPEEYLGQTMLYLYGLRASGEDAEYAVLTFIPRDSNKVSDIWVASCRYLPDVAEGLIKRASNLARVVRSGRMPELNPHPQCFPCVIRPRLAR